MHSANAATTTQTYTTMENILIYFAPFGAQMGNNSVELYPEPHLCFL